jgi:hypothetical protein
LPVQLLWLALCPRAPALPAGVFMAWCRPGTTVETSFEAQSADLLRLIHAIGLAVRTPRPRAVVSRDYRPLILLDNGM